MDSHTPRRRAALQRLMAFRVHPATPMVWHIVADSPHIVTGGLFRVQLPL